MTDGNDFIPPSVRVIKNGGIEQALLQLAKEEGCISETDERRLEELQSLNQNRIELVDGTVIANKIR